MAFTGQLGTADSYLGNIMLGSASFAPPPPNPIFPILTLLPRDPMVPPRLRRFTDLQSDVHNSLVRSGQLTQVAVSEWEISIFTDNLPLSGVVAGTYSFGPFTFDEHGLITDANNGVLSGIGPPSIGNGAAGWIYFDVTDPNDPLFYYRD